MTEVGVSLTTWALIDAVRHDPNATERELVLLDKLCASLDEIDDLVAEFAGTRVTCDA